MRRLRTLVQPGISRRAAGAIMGVVLLGGCSSSVAPPAGGSGGATATSLAPRPSDRLFNDDLGVGIGATFTIPFGDGGSEGVLSSTLTRSVDRATGSPAAGVGTRYSAYAFSILDETQDTTAPAFPIVETLTAYGYKGGSYPALAGVRLDAGTMIPDGPIVLANHATVVGWAVFAIPSDDFATLVRLAPTGPIGNQATWDVRPPTPASTPGATHTTPGATPEGSSTPSPT